MSFLPYDPGGAGSWVFATLSSTVTHGGVLLLAFGSFAPLLAPVAAPPERPDYTITLERLDTDTLAGILEQSGQANAGGDDSAPPDVPVPDRVEPAPPEEMAALAPELATPTEVLPEAVPPAEALVPEPAAPATPEPVQPEAPETIEPVEAPPQVAAAPAASVPPSLSPVVPEAAPDPGPLIPETVLPTGPLDSGATVVSSVAPLAGSGQVVPETVTSRITALPANPVTVAAPPAPPVNAPPVNAPSVSAPSVNAPAPAPPTAQDLAVGDLIARIRATPSEECLLVLPRRDGVDGVGLAMVAGSEPAMTRFADALLTEAEGAIRQTRTLIDLRQCAALAFVGNNRDYPATRLGIAIDAAEVPSGGRLTGTVRGTAGRYVLLLLIDNNGVVQDLQRFLNFSGNILRFDVPVTRAGPVRDTSQLLLAIASDQPPATLQARNGQLAEDVFSGIPEANGRFAAMGFATFDVQ